MKDNREFLDGIYAKAKILEEEKRKKNTRTRYYLQLTSVAALLILIPFFAFKDNILGNQPIETRLRPGQEISAFSLEDEDYFLESDYIALGKVLDSTNLEGEKMRIEIKKTFLGRTEKLIMVEGLEEYRGESLLLFLKEEKTSYSLVEEQSFFIEIKEDVFQDSHGNIFTIQDIEDNIRRKNK